MADRQQRNASRTKKRRRRAAAAAGTDGLAGQRRSVPEASPRPNGKKARYRVTSARTPKKDEILHEPWCARACGPARALDKREKEVEEKEDDRAYSMRVCKWCMCGVLLQLQGGEHSPVVGPCAVRGNRTIRGAPVRRSSLSLSSFLPLLDRMEDERKSSKKE